MRFVRSAFLSLLILVGVTSAPAFSLLGPFASWQVFRIGYQVPGDIGGPMNLTEEYRWNIKTISYGFDQSFIGYFGQRGVDEVNKAVAIINNLPAVSKMSPNLSEFPLDSRRYNSRAAALNLIDLKSTALSLLMEEMGLADPERFVWCLRARQTFPNDIIDYSVIMRNFDPVTWEPSKYVNGTLFTYEVIDSYWAPNDGSDAVEVLVDPLDPTLTAVASFSVGNLNYGQFYTGLTRDDVGGLRYMLRKNNYNTENLLTNMVASSAVGPWSPVGGTNFLGTNILGTNLLVNIALRPGVEKILLKQMRNFAGIGSFVERTNQYTDVFVVDDNGNRKLVKQKTQRDLIVPDIIFTAGDIGTAGAFPVLVARTTTDQWANNAALNTDANLGITSGPGVIQPPVVITFNNVGPFNFNESPGFLDEVNTVLSGWVWGSFDGTTNAPIVYPNQQSIETLEDLVLGPGN